MEGVNLGFQHPDTTKATSLKTPLLQRLNPFRRAPEKSKHVPVPDVVFDRREFTEETGTDNREKVRFDENMQLQYRTYLKNHVNQLAKAYKKNSKSPLFTSEKYRHHMALMERLCGGDAQSGFTLDSKKIAEELKKDHDLWIVATQMMEEDIALTTWGMGQLAAVDPGRFNKAKGIFDAKPGNGQIKLQINQGRINRMLPALGKLANGLVVTASSATGGAVTGAILGGPVGALTGAFVGGVVLPACGILKSALKNGVSIKIDSRPGLMAAMQDPSFDAEATYLSEILDFEVSDFTIHRPGPLGRALGRKASVERNAQLPGSTDIAKVQEDLMSKMLTRYNFFTNEKGLHIPPNKVNMIPENVYFDAKNHSGVRTVWEKEMQSERNEATVLFERQNGRPPNTAERMLIDQEARKKTIVRRLEKALIKDLSDDDKIIQLLKDREGAFSKGEGTAEHGREILKLTKELKEENEALDAINTTLTTEQSTLKTYAEKQEAFKKAQKEAQDAFGTSEIRGLKEIRKQREKVTDTRLDELIQQLTEAEDAIEIAKIQGERFDSNFRTASAELASITGVDAILIGVGLTPVGLTLADVASLPMSEIMQRVNNALDQAQRTVPPTPLPGAWSVEDNLDLTRRQQVLYIIAEARSQVIEPMIATPGPDFATFNSAIGGGGYALNENFIRSATIPEIIAEVNRNTGVATLDATIPADVARVKAVMEVATRRYSARRDKLQGVLTQEPVQREQYNSRVVATRTSIEAQIARLEASVPNLSQGEASLARFRNIPHISTDYIGEHFVEYSDSLNLLAGMHAHCTGIVGYANELDPATLHTKSLADILTAVHLADTLGSANAWPPGMDGENDHVRSVVAAYAESKAVAKLGPLLTDNADLGTLVATHGLSYEQIRTLTDPQIVDLVNAGGGGWVKNAAHYTRIKNARTQVVQRFDARKNELSKAIQTARIAGGILAPLSNADLAFLETNDEYTHLRSAVMMRQALQVQKDSLVELGDLSSVITGVQAEISTYDTARTSLQNKRSEIRKAFDENDKTRTELVDEKKTREDHPTTELDTVISSLETAQSSLKLTSVEAQAAKKVTDDIAESFAKINNIDAQLIAAGLPVVGLDVNDLLVLSYPELCRRINNAHAAGAGLVPPIDPPIGWPKERNGEATNRDKIGQAIAGARVQVKINGIIIGLNPVVRGDVASVSTLFSDLEMFSMSPEDFEAETNRRGAAIVPPVVINTAQAEAILEVYAKFFHTYGEAEHKVQEKNTSRITDISYETSHIAESFEDRKEFITRTKEMAKSQGKMYGRIPGFIHSVVNDPDFALPINPADVNFAGSERVPTPRGGAAIPNVPKGYYELMNFMFNYYDTVAPLGRGEAFQKLLNVEHFRPERIAHDFSDQLNLSRVIASPPPYTIQEVCVAIQTQMRDGSISRSDFYHGIKGIMDSYISEIKAMS